MPEPTTAGTAAAGSVLVAIAINIVGSRWGPLAATATGGLVGAFVSLGAFETGGSKLAALRYLASYTMLASLASGGIAYLVALWWHIDPTEILVLVALVVGLIGGQWSSLVRSFVAACSKLAGTKTEGRAP